MSTSSGQPRLTRGALADAVARALPDAGPDAADGTAAAIAARIQALRAVLITPEPGSRTGWSSIAVLPLPGREDWRGAAAVMVQSARTGHVAAFACAAREGIGGAAFMAALIDAVHQRPTDPGHRFVRLTDVEAGSPAPRDPRAASGAQADEASDVLGAVRASAAFTLNPLGPEARRYLDLISADAVAPAAAPGADPNGLEALRAAVAGELGGHLRARLSAFRQTLDDRVRAVTFKTNTHTLASHNFYAAKGDPDLRERRIAATDAFPLLGGPLRGVPGLSRAIDAGMRPETALETELGLPSGVVAGLRGVSHREAGKPVQAAIERLLPALAEITPEHLPGRPGQASPQRQWQAFAAWADPEVLSAWSGRARLDRRSALAALAPEWLAGRLPAPETPEMRRAAADLHRILVLPLVAERRRNRGAALPGIEVLAADPDLGPDLAFELIAAGRAPSDTAAAAAAWDRGADAARAALEALRPAADAAASYRIEGSAIAIAPLPEAERARFAAELGLRDYARPVPGARPLALRTEDGAALSLAWIDPVRGEAEHHGADDGDPPRLARLALRLHLDARSRKRAGGEDPLDRLAGYPARDPAARAAAFALVRPLLGEGADDIASWIRRTGIDRRIDARLDALEADARPQRNERGRD